MVIFQDVFRFCLEQRNSFLESVSLEDGTIPDPDDRAELDRLNGVLNKAFVCGEIATDLFYALLEARAALFNGAPVTEGLENQINAAIKKAEGDE